MSNQGTHAALGAAATAASFVPVYGWIAAGVLTIANMLIGSGPSQENVNEENAFNLRVKLAQTRQSLGIADSFAALGAWGSGKNAQEFATEVENTIGGTWTPADYTGTAQAMQDWQNELNALEQEGQQEQTANTVQNVLVQDGIYHPSGADYNQQQGLPTIPTTVPAATAASTEATSIAPLVAAAGGMLLLALLVS